LALNLFIQPAIAAERLEGHCFGGWPASWALVLITILVLAGALLNHWWGARKTGSGLKAVDHIHYAPGLHYIYDKAEKRVFDPYNLGLAIATIAAHLLFWIDRGVDWIYNVLAVKITFAFTGYVRWLQNGNYAAYVLWYLVGTGAILFLVLR
jgi:NADH-quinone oxidoreductase subunit L